MKNFLCLAKQKFNDKFFIKIYLSASIPVLLVFFVLMCEIFAFTNKSITNTKMLYAEKVESIYNSNERSLDNITMLISALFDNPTFYNAATSSEIPVSSSDISDLFNNIKNVNPFIDSVSVYDKVNQKIYTNSGTVDANTYFTQSYIYAEYPKSFWDNYKSVMFSRRVIAPSEVSMASGTKTIIPMVFTKLTNKHLSNMIIVNIDVTQLLQAASTQQVSAGSRFYIINKQRKIAYTLEGISDFVFSDDFYGKLNTEQNISFTTKLDGKKYIIIGQSPSSSILGYTYIVTIPYNDVYINSHLMIFTFIFISIVLLAVLIIMIFITSGRIYEPIQKLLSLFPKSNQSQYKKRNLLNSLQNATQNILTANSKLNDKYSQILPLAQEKQLIDLRNQNKHYDFDLKNVDIDFQYPYFCVVVYKIIPTRLFYNSYTKHEYLTIKDGLINLLQEIYPKEFQCYILASEASTIYSLLNVPDDQCMEKIESSIDEFLNTLTYDKKYLKATATHGGIYTDIEGLVKSHLEATDNAPIFSGFNHLQTIDTPSAANKIIPFNAADESTISNLLITGRTEQAKETIETMLKNLMDKNVSENIICNFFSSLLNLIFKIMQTKNIPYDTEHKGNITIINQILEQPIKEIYETTIAYVDTLANINDTKTTIDVDSVIQYIEAHFAEDLSLDMLAEQYNTTAKYLSKLIKDKLGIKFTAFLSDLRVLKAQDLLLKSKKSIDDICTLSGFSNRTSFSRTFKAKTGLTPSEYRKMNK